MRGETAAQISRDVQHLAGGNQPGVGDLGTVHLIQPRPRDGLAVEPLRNPRQSVPSLDSVRAGRQVRVLVDHLHSDRWPTRGGLVYRGSYRHCARHRDGGRRLSCLLRGLRRLRRRRVLPGPPDLPVAAMPD